MRLAVAMTMAVGMMAPALVSAEESVIGKYTGSFIVSTSRGPIRTGLGLVLDSAEGGVVKGNAKIFDWSCAGDYPMEGTLAEGKMQLRSTAKGGRAGDCSLRLNLAVDGDRLTGTTGSGQPVQLSK